MDVIIKLTQSVLQKIFKKIRTELSNRDKYIMAAALQGKTVKTVSKGAALPSQKKAGDIVYNQNDNTYRYWSGSSWTELTLSYLLQSANSVTYLELFRSWEKIASSNHDSMTPFVDNERMILGIWKGESCGSYTKWLIEMNTEDEQQTYSAGRTVKDKYYGTHTVPADGESYNAPWELWLPSDLAAKSVVIHY